MGPYSTVTVDDLSAVLRGLPMGQSAVQAVGHCLGSLDGRALAALLKELHKCGLAHQACEIFDWLSGLPPGHDYWPLLDVFTYTTMIAQCSGPGPHQVARAQALLADMRARGVAPNTHTYSSMINVCIKGGEIEMAKEVYSQMLSKGLAPNLVTYNTLLEAYAKMADWEGALRLLEVLRRQGLVGESRTFHTVMAACNAAGRHHQCLAVFSALLGSGRSPSTAAFNSAIAAHCRLGDMDAAWGLLQDMTARGCERTPATYMLLLQAAERLGRWITALDVISSMEEAGVHVTPQACASAVAACASAGQLSAARALVARLGGPSSGARSCGPAPAHMLISMHARCCDWGAAQDAFDGLAATGVPADAATYGALALAHWECGTATGCLLGLKAFDQACRAGAFRLVVSVDDVAGRVTLSLPAVGPGMAVAALWRMLEDLNIRVARSGAHILRQSVVLIVGVEGQQQDPAFDDALHTICCAQGSPFSLLPPESPFPRRPGGSPQHLADSSPGRGAAAAHLVAHSGALALWLSKVLGAPGGGGGGSSSVAPVLAPADALVQLDAAALLRRQAAVLQAAAAEYSRLLDSEAPPGALLGAANAGGRQLHGQPPPHERSAAASGAPSLSASDSTNSMLAASASASASASLSTTSASAPALASDSMASGQAASSSYHTLGGERFAAAAAAALALLRGALMTGAAAQGLALAVPGLTIPEEALLGCAAWEVVQRAASLPLACGAAAPQVAELALCASRRAAGLWPAWPQCLVEVTGCPDPEAAEPQRQKLAAMIASLAAEVYAPPGRRQAQ